MGESVNNTVVEELCPQSPPSTRDENKSTVYQDMICLGRKGGQSLKGEGPGSFSSMGFYWVYLHRNTRHIWKAHQSLSGSNDQTVDNIQRTLRAYLQSGSDS